MDGKWHSRVYDVLLVNACSVVDGNLYGMRKKLMMRKDKNIKFTNKMLSANVIDDCY